VLLSTRHLNLRGACPKLAPKFIGPFKILRARGNTVELELPPEIHIHPIINVERLKPFTGEYQPPAPIEVAGEEEWEVEAILGKRERYNKPEYLVQWRGFGPEHNSWEPASNLVHAGTLVEQFEDTYRKRAAGKRIIRTPRRLVTFHTP
jgi:hypothetical protein